MRRFYLRRNGSAVAAAVEFGPFGSGLAVIHWFGPHAAIAIYADLNHLKAVHLHAGDSLEPVDRARCSECIHWRWEEVERSGMGQCARTASNTYRDDECPGFSGTTTPRSPEL